MNLVRFVRWVLGKYDAFFTITVILFILVWPLEKRKLFLTEHSFVTGAYTEGGTMALYLSDIAFFLLVLAWAWRKQRRPQDQSRPPLPRLPLLIGGMFVLWALIRAFPLHPSLLGWYAAGRIAQGFLVMLITADVWRTSTIRLTVLRTLVLAGVFQSLLGITQVVTSSDLGFRFLGEHPLSLESPGVAKVDIINRYINKVNVPQGTFEQNGTDYNISKKVLRAYGTFPHPNVLGWFLLSSVASVALLKFGSCKEGGTFSKKWKLFLEEQFTHPTLVSVLVAGILTTFSRASWIGLLILICSFFLKCSDGNICKRSFSVVLYASIVGVLIPVLIISGIRSATFSRIVPPGTDLFVSGRVSSLESFSINRNNFFGLGTGSGIIEVVKNKNEKAGNVPIGTSLDPWEYQYPHSVPFIIILELGFLGLGISLFILYNIFAKYAKLFYYRKLHNPKRAWAYVLLLVAFLPSLLFDHFPWTIQQGRTLLWGGLGVLLASSVQKRGSAGAMPSGTDSGPMRFIL